MGNLGNFLSTNDRKTIIDRQLQPGRVLYLLCDFPEVSKDKYLVFLCPDVHPLFFIINSSIHPYIVARPHLLSCQVRMASTDYDFLDHDSYIHCADVKTLFSDDEVRSQLFNDTSRIKGILLESTKREIIRVVQAARTLSRKHKRMIVAALQ